MKSRYICSSCGSVAAKWCGKCPDCGDWNTMIESIVENSPKNQKAIAKTLKSYNMPSKSSAKRIEEIDYPKYIRNSTGINEFDRVLGGGLVKGSVVLLSGEPGIGKSTLLLQICQSINCDLPVLYVSGEESPAQIKMRADRLGVDNNKLFVLSETNVNKLIPEIDLCNAEIVIIDSIQTMFDDEIASYPGTVTQVRQTTMQLINKAKSDNISIIIIGHVNKDGAIAGPKVLEHMVDAVLYFEGDKQHIFRIIRAAKNRFGSTNEIGVFEMAEEGLSEVTNPSEMLMEQRQRDVSGSSAVCVLEGSRPLIAEIQALATTTVYPSPRRMSSGVDYNRLALILAVLEKRLGLKFSVNDVYLNVAGGLKLEDPACDLAAAVSLVSTLKDLPVPDDIIFFGEIGLSGECRAVVGVQMRLNEAERLGFKRAAVPHKNISKITKPRNIELIIVKSVYDIIKILS